MTENCSDNHSCHGVGFRSSGPGGSHSQPGEQKPWTYSIVLVLYFELEIVFKVFGHETCCEEARSWVEEDVLPIPENSVRGLRSRTLVRQGG